MGEAERAIEYPHIVSDGSIAGGAPIIKGTRVTVRSVSGYYQMGMTVDEILSTLSHLSAAEVHSALAYYFDHQEEIDRDLEASNDEEYWKSRILRNPDCDDTRG